MQDGKAEQYNDGKLRYDLIPAFAEEQEAAVWTFGVGKYSPTQWRRGRKWSDIISSMKRHLASIEGGEDFDHETGILHSAHLRSKAGMLTEYYKIYPQGDDREIFQLPKIGLDIDDVLADLTGAWSKRFNAPLPLFWRNDYESTEKFNELKDDKDFWLNIEPLVRPEDIPFEPHCYVTSRIIPQEWTEEWIQKNRFATCKVYSLGHEQSKVDTIKNAGIEVFVDDKYDTFIELNTNGVLCYLLTREHNARYNVGFRRIDNLSDLVTLKHLKR